MLGLPTSRVGDGQTEMGELILATWEGQEALVAPLGPTPSRGHPHLSLAARP